MIIGAAMACLFTSPMLELPIEEGGLAGRTNDWVSTDEVSIDWVSIAMVYSSKNPYCHSESLQNRFRIHTNALIQAQIL